MQRSTWTLAIVGLSLIWRSLVARRWVLRGISRGRALELGTRDEPSATQSEEREEPGPLGRWLALAGHRDPGAPRRFVGLTLAMFVLGLLAAYLLRRSGLIAAGVHALEHIPGGVGEVFMPVLYVGPWI